MQPGEREPKESIEARNQTARLRKPYTKPEIVYELQLETGAGSPLSVPDPYDPFHLEPYKSYQDF